MHYKKIAIVKLTAMGDIIHTAVVLQFIKKHYPDLIIDWFVESAFSEVLKHNPHIDTIYELDLKSVKKRYLLVYKRYKALKALAKNDYDLVVDAQGLLKSAIVAKILSKNCAGFDKNSIREKIAACLYGKTVASAYETNVIERNVTLFNRLLDFDTTKEDILNKEPFLYYKDANPIIERFLSVEKKNIIYVIGASWQSKRYAIQRFIEVIRTLKENAIIVSGNDVEAADASYICENTHAQMMPKIDLNTLKALIAKSDLVIGNDTGPTHMAWAMNTPSLTLFGNTPAYRNAYETPINQTIQSKKDINPLRLDKNDFCINDIDPQTVVAYAQNILKESREQ
jgi:heptosyltransferase-1